MDNDNLYTEKELFLLIAQGDESAFKQLYAQLGPSLAGFIFKLARSQDAVKEVMQESLFRLWMGREKLSEIQNPRSWFFKVVSNECHRYFRKNGLRNRLAKELEERSSDTDETDIPEAELSFRETKQIIHQSVARLSSRQREIYKLSREQGLKIPEIALHLGLSEKYVKKTLIHALHIIRKKLLETGKYLPLFLL